MAKQSKITFNLNGLNQFKSQIKGYRARVGILGDKATRGDGPLNNAEIGLLALTGSITNNTPARDWLLMPIEYKQREILRQMAASSVKAALGRGDIKTVFKLLGAIAEGFIQEAFQSGGFGQWAPNAPSTIDRKGSNSPLIDTAQLRRSVTSTVVKKGATV